jgi:hypothetical protein
MKKNISKTLKVSLAFLFVTIGLIPTSCSKEAVIETINTIEEAIETEEETTETEATLDNLNGDWIRVASNNPIADGMIIEMKDSSGTLTDNAGSNFKVGDIKWKDIKALDTVNYSHQELGSDYNYYSAKMVLKSDDTLRITVGSSGAGNIQKWVREGEYIPNDNLGPETTETLSCTISSARTLVNGTSSIDYFVDCVIDITAPLTIEPGTVIQFGENAGLGVYDNGTIKAVGTVAEPIVFQGATSIDGFWRGIHIETRSINNQLENVQIKDAGSNYVYCCNGEASLFLKGAKIALNGVNISNGGSNGLMAINDTEFDTYSNVRIESQKEYPVHIEPQTVSYLDGTNSDYSGNDKDFVFVSNKGIAEPTTWYALNVPYLIEGKVVDITSALTLQDGVDIIFEQNGGLGIYDDGSLTVKGLENSPVVMRGAMATPGYWRGIHIETTNPQNSLNYLQLSDAGSNYVYCCNDAGSLFLKNGTASVTNSTFSNGKSYGIVTKLGFEFEEYGGNTITSHQEAPMYITANTMGQLDGLDSSYVGNTKDYLLVYDSNVNKEITVLANNVPFQVDYGVVLDVTAKLSLKEGVEFVFEENSGLGIYDNGILNVVGTANDRVIFRGLENINGYWRGIHTETNSSSNLIRHSEIRNAGSNYVYCCNDKAALFIKAGQMTIENSLIAKSGGCGVYVKAGATLTELNNEYSENTEGDLCN